MTTVLFTSPTCPWCGDAPHKGKCPLIKAVEFQPDGVTAKRLEFWSRAELDKMLLQALPAVSETQK